jgi:hypothetical protein
MTLPRNGSMSPLLYSRTAVKGCHRAQTLRPRAFEGASMFCYEVYLYMFALLIHIHSDLQLHQTSGAVASMSGRQTKDPSRGPRATLNKNNLSELDFELDVVIIARELAPTWHESLRAAQDATTRTVGLMQNPDATDEERLAAQRSEVRSYQTQELHRTLLWADMERLGVTDADSSAVSTAFFRVHS